MRRLSVALITACLLLAACATNPTPTPEPVVTPAPRPANKVPNRAYYTKRCWPACHYDSEAVKPVPHPTVHDFEGELPADARWINEDTTHWTLAEKPGVLRIVSQGGLLSDDLQGARNVLVYDAPDGHFDIVARVNFDPASEAQNATIFVHLSDGHVVSLSRGYHQEGGVGSGVYLAGPESNCPPAAAATSEKSVLLMLRRAGRSYIGYYGAGEGDWIEVGRCTNLATPPAIVGLVAVNDTQYPSAPEIAADFDSFTLMERH
jgi:beta-xylosidase